MERDTERALVRGLKAGDENAFDQVYEAHRATVYSFLCRLSRDRVLAEDLLEETWFRLVSRGASLTDDSRILPWLLTVARNLFMSDRRSRRSERNRDQDLAHIEGGRRQADSPFEQSAGNQLRERIERALASLPARQREVLLLISQKGLTPAEAASICGTTPQAMRQRLCRARAKLIATLEEGGVELPLNPKTRLIPDV